MTVTQYGPQSEGWGPHGIGSPASSQFAQEHRLSLSGSLFYARKCEFEHPCPAPFPRAALRWHGRHICHKFAFKRHSLPILSVVLALRMRKIWKRALKYSETDGFSVT